MHGTHRVAGSNRRDGLPVADAGADFDPDAEPFRGPVLVGYAISRDAYLHRLSVAVAHRAATLGVVNDRADYLDCVRLVHRRALLHHFGIRPGNPPFRGDRIASAVAGRRLGRAAASAKVNWNVML